MPSRKTKKGEYKDVAHPINSDFRGTLQDRILEEYERQVEEGIGEEDNNDETLGAASQ